MQVPPAPWLYLASQSPRRRQLLDQIGVSHRLLLPLPNQDAEALEAERAGEPARDYVCRLTLAKWEAACARLTHLQHGAGLSAWPQAPILCADTTVALDGQILGKPTDAAHAAQMLQSLSGRSHEVHTAVAVQGRVLLSTSQVQWRTLSDSDIHRYVASAEPM